MIERYLWELRRALGRRLPPDVLAARLREAEGHLRMAASEMGETEAVRRYGPARLAANGVVRAYRGYAAASPWRLGRGVGILLFAAFALPMLWMNFLLREERPLDGFAAAYRWGPFLALIAFGLRAAQTRRWLVLPALSWVLAASAVYAAGDAFFPPFPTGAKARRAYARTIRYYDAQLRDAKVWRSGSPPLSRAPQPYPVTEIDSIPLTPIQYGKPGTPFIELGAVRSGQESRRLWNRFGATWEASVVARRSSAIEGLWRSPAKVDRLAQLAGAASALPRVLLGSALVLTLVNAAALGFAAMGERFRMRRA